MAESVPTFEEARAKCDAVYANTAANLIEPGTVLGADLHEAASKFAAMFERTDGGWRPIVTNIHSVAIREVPEATRKALHAAARRYADVFPTGHDLYVVPSSDYHVSLLVPQDCSAPESPENAVLEKADRALSSAQIRELAKRLERSLAEVPAFDLVPTGLGLGGDGTLFFGFTLTPEVWELRRRIYAETLEVDPNGPTSRPKALVNVTLVRALDPLELTDERREALRRLGEASPAVGSLPVARVSFIHERRWMMSDVDTAGETIIPLAQRSH